MKHLFTKHNIMKLHGGGLVVPSEEKNDYHNLERKMSKMNIKPHTQEIKKVGKKFNPLHFNL